MNGFLYTCRPAGACVFWACAYLNPLDESSLLLKGPEKLVHPDSDSYSALLPNIVRSTITWTVAVGEDTILASGGVLLPAALLRSENAMKVMA